MRSKTKSSLKPKVAKSTPSTQVTEQLQHALTLHQQGQLVQAQSIYEQILQNDPQHFDSLHLLGVVAYQTKDYPKAIDLISRAIAIVPNYAQAHYSLGNSFRGLRRLTEAEDCYRQALQLQANFPEAHNNLGNTLKDLGRLEEAKACYQDLLIIDANFVAAHNNLGNVLKDLGRPIEAEACYHRAIEIAPTYAEAHNNLGNTLKDLGRLEEAEACFRQAIELMPEYDEACYNLGNTLKDLGRPIEAEACYRRAIEIAPTYAEAHNNLGTILKDLLRLVEAETCFRQALTLKPDFTEVYGNLAMIRGHLSDYADMTKYSDLALINQPDSRDIWSVRLYMYIYHPDLSAQEIYTQFVNWGNQFAEPNADLFSTRDRQPGRRLRVGYVSPDFRAHSCRFFFEPLFSHHDKDQVELFAYSNVVTEDQHTEHFKGQFDHWRSIRAIPDQEVAELIRHDQIDILIDACGHMFGERLGIFALKPAPIQVTWLGAAWTTGLPMVDYVLFDHHMAPEGTLAREKIVRLPDCFAAYQPRKTDVPVASLPALKNGYITFGYSGRTERLNHRVFQAWGEILQRLPEARLILDFGSFADPLTKTYYQEFLAKHGVDTTRVTMRWSDNIFEGLGDIDVLLDSFPHSGGTMLFDALWMGVPALTLASRPPLGRIGTTLMSNLGLGNWVAYSETEYINKAVEFAGQIESLAKLRLGMRERMTNSPVMDGARFAMNVESAYRTMWERWCAGDLPAAFDVPSTVVLASTVVGTSITVDGKDYLVDDLSAEVKAQLRSLWFADSEIRRLQAQLAAMQTARNAYATELKLGLVRKF